MTNNLEKVSLLHGLSRQQLTEVSLLCSELSLHDGDMLIQEADAANTDLYLLIQGSVEIVSNNSKITSSEVVISKEDIDVFGEIAWLTGSRRTASVRCHGNVLAIQIDGQKLHQYLNTHPEAGFIVMREIALIQSRRMQNTDSLLKQILWNSLL